MSIGSLTRGITSSGLPPGGSTQVQGTLGALNAGGGARKGLGAAPSNNSFGSGGLGGLGGGLVPVPSNYGPATAANPAISNPSLAFNAANGNGNTTPRSRLGSNA